MNIRYNLA